MAKEISMLTEIEVRCFLVLSIPVNGLKEIIRSGKQLKHIKLNGVKRLHINKKAIVILLDAVKFELLSLSIDLKECKHKTSLDAPIDFTNTERKFKSSDHRLEISYKEERCFNC